MEKLHVCICGKSFQNKQALTCHNYTCKEFCLDKFGNLDYYHARLNKTATNMRKTKSIQVKQRLDDRTKQFELWISEKHECETCGKVMTELYGSGRFCSRSCACSHSYSDETRKKISDGVKNSQRSQSHAQGVHDTAVQNYLINPSFCEICGEQLPYGIRWRKTCSDQCLRALVSMNQTNSIKRHGGNTNKRGLLGKCKYGTYKGIECDSSYELAFVIYCFDHDIEISRNRDHFEYYTDGVKHNYFPDFKVGDVYVEIKGYVDDLTITKYDQFPIDKYIVIISDEKMVKFLDYCKSTYGNNFTMMYDEDKPHWTY